MSEEKRVVVDCFLPSLLRYDDHSTHVVEEIAKVASMTEAGR